MGDRARVVITGISGTLGAALGRLYRERGWQVMGVSRRADAPGAGDVFDDLVNSPQRSRDDACALLALRPRLIILNAGKIETEIGPGGLPLLEQAEAMNLVNYHFPAMVALAAAEHQGPEPLDIVAVGSIADGSPSCFGPVYHATKIALNYFVSGVGPIIHRHNPLVRVRLYRPGVIYSPPPPNLEVGTALTHAEGVGLSWAPLLRLNERATRIRVRRCERAPAAAVIAQRIARFIDSRRWVASDPEPVSFKLLKYLHSYFPNSFYKLQRWAWAKGSRFADPTAGAGSSVPVAQASPSAEHPPSAHGS
jgi:NAD(P)-dependent dehydrogenase (short-subunit alcohol dehydrogenase family)